MWYLVFGDYNVSVSVWEVAFCYKLRLQQVCLKSGQIAVKNSVKPSNATIIQVIVDEMSIKATIEALQYWLIYEQCMDFTRKGQETRWEKIIGLRWAK